MPIQQSLARFTKPSQPGMRPAANLTPAMIVAAGIGAMVVTTVGYLFT